ncbi:MAG: hypothetical protein DA408_03900 [Bacteroidetes bacterium]|nr:MAG: hypothetical protein DA408_03900 [Bacteroidota bacterium]
MDLWHEYEGDLSIFVEACGQVLNVLQRPGAVGNCDAGCSGLFSNCGSGAPIGTEAEPAIINFYNFGPEPDNGIAAGGSFGLTLDDSCGVSTLGLNTFESLWSNCPGGLVEAQICFSDHAFLHRGYVSNLAFIFPNLTICGCLDPGAINYNPDASVGGTCLYDCPDLGIAVANSSFNLCAGGDTISLAASALLADSPTFEWVGSGNSTSYLANAQAPTTEVYIPADFVGTISYTVTVRDAYGCLESETVTVDVLPAAVPVITGDLFVCGNDSTTLLLTGGPFASQLWNTGATGDTLRVAAGPYAVTVTSANGCSRSTTFTVGAYDLPSPAILGPDSSCVGENVVLRADTVFASYLWSTGATADSTVVSAAQTYTLAVVDSNGCTGSAAFVLAHFDTLAPLILGADRFCPGDSVLLAADPGFATYQWSTGDTTLTTWVGTADTIRLTVTETNSCRATTAVVLQENPLPQPLIVAPAALCPGDSATLASQQSYPNYQWSTGEMTAAVVTTAAGVFELTVTDSLGCSGSTSYNLLPAVPIMSSLTGDTLFCAGTTTTLTVTPAVASYTYAWSNQTTDPTVTLDQAGTYVVTITSDQGCTQVLQQTVATYPPANVNIQGPAFICLGDRARLSAPLGFSSYLWSTGETSASITASTAGTFDLVLTDSNSCPVQTSFVLGQYPFPDLSISGDTLVCAGEPGQLSATPGFATYTWGGGEQTATIDFLVPGLYTLTAQDSLGCTASAAVEVMEIVLQPTIAGTGVICAGSTTQLGVAATFQAYLWSDGATGTSITVDQPGAYTVTVTDAQGCSATASTVVVVQDLPMPTIAGANPFCPGDSATLVATAGFVSYQWSLNNQNTSSVNVSQASTYTVSVTDAVGCVGTATAEVTTYPQPTPTITGTLAFCPGAQTLLSSGSTFSSYLWSTGETTPAVEVGTPGVVALTVVDNNGCSATTSVMTTSFATELPVINGDFIFCLTDSTTLQVAPDFVTYTWSTGQTGPQIVASAPGLVAVTVTDANNCPTNTSILLANYPASPLAIVGPAGFCAGDSVTLTTSANYPVYQWSTGATGPATTVTVGGEITLAVTDVNGCVARDTVAVAAYALPTPTILGNLSFCTGNTTTLTAGGGDFATYQWSDGNTAAATVIGIPGPVALTVTDDNGCPAETGVTVTEVAELTPEVVGELLICPGDSTVLRPTETFASYLWSTGAMTDSIVVSTSGNYTLEVTDDAGCQGLVAVTVNTFANPLVEITGPPYFCTGSATELQATPGFATYSWTNGTATNTVAIDQAGEVGVMAVDANGCRAQSSIMIREQLLPIFDVAGARAFCVDSFTALTVAPAFASYQWSMGDTTQTILMTYSGEFSVTVTDDFGCTAAQTIAVTSVDLPVGNVGTNQFLDCDTPVVVLGSPQSTQGGVAYQWTGPGIDSTNAHLLQPEVALPGVYSLVVTDTLLGCVSEPVGVQVTDLSYEPRVVLRVLDVLDCSTTIVVVDGNASDSGPQYTYQWYDSNQQAIPGASGPQYQALTAQIYTLEIIDTLTACSATAAILVEVNENYPQLDAGPDQILDCNQPVATWSGTVSPATANISFTWSTSNGSILTNPEDLQIATSTPAWYVLEATDLENGCTNRDSVLVTQNTTAPLAQTTGNQTLGCNESTATLNGASSSMGANFQYQWLFNGQAIPAANALQLVVAELGNYTLVVTDTTNGCAAVTTAEVDRDEAAPQAFSTAFVPPTCAGDQDGSILIGQVTGGWPPYLYSLAGGAFVPASQFTGLGAGSYALVIEDANGCQLNALVNLPDGNDVQLELGPNQTIQEGEEAAIFPQVSIDSAAIRQLQWQTVADLSCPECLNQLSLALTTSTQFFLTITDENGCSARDNLTIFVEKFRNIYVPNAFSPNGDGTNDEFYIFTDNKSVKEIRLFRIFNRWGEFIFENRNFPPNDPREGLDGLQQGRESNPAVFVWYAELELQDGAIIQLKGDVTLVK